MQMITQGLTNVDFGLSDDDKSDLDTESTLEPPPDLMQLDEQALVDTASHNDSSSNNITVPNHSATTFANVDNGGASVFHNTNPVTSTELSWVPITESLQMRHIPQQLCDVVIPLAEKAPENEHHMGRVKLLVETAEKRLIEQGYRLAVCWEKRDWLNNALKKIRSTANTVGASNSSAIDMKSVSVDVTGNMYLEWMCDFLAGFEQDHEVIHATKAPGVVVLPSRTLREIVNLVELDNLVKLCIENLKAHFVKAGLHFSTNDAARSTHFARLCADMWTSKCAKIISVPQLRWRISSVVLCGMHGISSKLFLKNA
eukprot:c10826_g1_i1.p1 GENE.c10826_g1_i1~~c10826_g1_i1.p1  ORF type:complete len:314 (-),score=57.43 c10826_g1_i1:736-1677(-)